MNDYFSNYFYKISEPPTETDAVVAVAASFTANGNRIDKIRFDCVGVECTSQQQINLDLNYFQIVVKILP